MSVKELESVVARLSPAELSAFAEWFEEFRAETWDQQIAADVRAGKLDRPGRQADKDFEAGRCRPL
jgi:hypothetical protein